MKKKREQIQNTSTRSTGVLSNFRFVLSVFIVYFKTKEKIRK